MSDSAPQALAAAPDLVEMMRRVDDAGWAADAYDSEWRLIWVTEELKTLLGTTDRAELGYGRHFIQTRTLPAWNSAISQQSALETLSEFFPFALHDTPGGAAAVVEGIEDPDARKFITSLEPKPPPPMWSWVFDFVRGETEFKGFGLAFQGREPSGELVGTLLVYTPGLRASVLALLSQGDSEMYERMAALVEPGRRAAAVVFADLQASGVLSRRLPSAAYFKLIRAFTTAIDDAVLANTGIVGKHVGDGVTAFFLADDLGSPSAAGRAAVQAARAISQGVRRAAEQIGDDTGVLEPDDVLVNVGVHWGGALYLGQLVTSGRLEVTALGDEVNECARLQEVARDGQALASKALVEQLSPADAEALDIDPDAVPYRTVSEIEGASEKAVRDAGSIAVTAL